MGHNLIQIHKGELHSLALGGGLGKDGGGLGKDGGGREGVEGPRCQSVSQKANIGSKMRVLTTKSCKKLFPAPVPLSCQLPIRVVTTVAKSEERYGHRNDKDGREVERPEFKT